MDGMVPPRPRNPRRCENELRDEGLPEQWIVGSSDTRLCLVRERDQLADAWYTGSLTFEVTLQVPGTPRSSPL